MTIRRAVLALALPTLVLGLAACTPAVVEPVESFAPVPPIEPEPAPALTPNPVEDDTTLIIRATATDTNGAQLDLELQVHRPSPWEYLGTRTLATAILEDCGAPLTEEVFEGERWSFTRANVTAIPPSGSAAWSEGSLVTVLPESTGDTIAGRGMLATECSEPKTVTAAGRGAMSLGIASDADALTAWASRIWGFAAGTGVTLSDCSIEVTAEGRTYGAGSSWTQATDATTCTTGP